MTQENLSGGLRYRFKKLLNSAYPLIGPKHNLLGYQMQMKPADYAQTIELLKITEHGRMSPEAMRRLVDIGQAFADNGADIEARLQHDIEHLNCPACGGSGHKGDIRHPGAALPDGWIAVPAVPDAMQLKAASKVAGGNFTPKFLEAVYQAMTGAAPVLQGSE